MYDDPKESDWKTFRKIVPELRERYLRQRNPELIKILEDDDLTPTEAFWTVEERIEKEAKILRKCLDGHSRSKMVRFMRTMYAHQMLTKEDLEPFSEEVRECILD